MAREKIALFGEDKARFFAKAAEAATTRLPATDRYHISPYKCGIVLARLRDMVAGDAEPVTAVKIELAARDRTLNVLEPKDRDPIALFLTDVFAETATERPVAVTERSKGSRSPA